jgi:hypothetical protein
VPQNLADWIALCLKDVGHRSTDQGNARDPTLSMTCEGADDLAAAPGVAHQRDLAQVQLIHERSQIIGQRIRIVAPPWVYRTPTPASIKRNATY